MLGPRETSFAADRREADFFYAWSEIVPASCPGGWRRRPREVRSASAQGGWFRYRCDEISTPPVPEGGVPPHLQETFWPQVPRNMRTSYPEKRMCSGCSSSYRALPLRPADPKQFENHSYRATGGSEAHPLREPYGNPYGSLREFQQPISSPWGVFLIVAPGGKGRPFVPLAASKHPEVPLQHVLSLCLILVQLLALHPCQCRFYCLCGSSCGC